MPACQLCGALATASVFARAARYAGGLYDESPPIDSCDEHVTQLARRLKHEFGRTHARVFVREGGSPSPTES